MNTSSRQPLATMLFAGLTVFLSCPPVLADVVVFSDDNFDEADWDVVVETTGDGGDGTSEHKDMGGNPGDYREVSITVADTQEGDEGAFVAVYSISPGATYDPSEAGPISSIDYEEDSIFLFSSGLVGGGQAAAPALRQDGLIYTLPVGLTFATPEDAWTHHSIEGLTQEDFISRANPGRQPDFSPCGSPIEFGFYRANSQPAGNVSGTRTGGIDNWEISVNNTAPEPFFINAGLNDAWFNPATAGQGFFFTVFPDITSFFLAWFTYDTERPAEGVMANLGEPGHRWVTAFGEFVGDSVDLDVELTSGGVFDNAQPAVMQQPGYGTIMLKFHNCSCATLLYDFPGPGRVGEIPLRRIANDNVARCEDLNTELPGL